MEVRAYRQPRREGLYTQLISVWRKQRDTGVRKALERPVGRPKAGPRDREITQLKAKVGRLETELAKARTVSQACGTRPEVPRPSTDGRVRTAHQPLSAGLSWPLT